MSKLSQEQHFESIGQSITDSIQGQLFGKPCFKMGKKAYVCFFEECMVFKLTGEQHITALSLPGAQLFDPSQKGRPMKEWVQLPFTTQEEWKHYASEAAKYVGQLK